MATGTVVYTGTAEYTNAEIRPTGLIVNLVKTGSYPSSPYEISSAQLSFKLYGSEGLYATLIFSANGSTQVGSLYLNGGGGTRTTGLSTSFAYASLSTLKIASDAAAGTRLAGSKDVVLTVTWQETTTACTAPRNVWIGASDEQGKTGTENYESNPTLRWNGSSGGTNNEIVGYDIQYKDGDGSWALLKSVGASTHSTTVALPDRGIIRQYRVRTKGAAGSSWYSGYTESTNKARKNTLPTAPWGLSASPLLYESGDVILFWHGSSDWTGGVAGYKIQYRMRASSSDSWGSWTDDGTTEQTTSEVSVIKTPVLNRGAQIQYRVCAYDVFTAYGSYSEFAEITRNSAPSKVTNLTVSASIWESGGLALRWSAATDPDGNFDHYLLSYQLSADGSVWDDVVEIGTTQTLTYDVTPPAGLVRGGYIRYLVTSVDALDAVSEAASVDVRRNTIPSVPTNLSISPLLYETGLITATWSASTDEVGALARYEIQARKKPVGGSWGNWAADDSTDALTFTRSPVLDRGSFIQYRIRAVDVYGVASDYAEFQAVQKNTRIGAPVNLTVDRVLFEDHTLTLEWEAPDNPLETLDHYEAAYSMSVDDGWSDYTTLFDNITVLTCDVASAVFSASRGQQVRIGVRTWDSLGVASEWAFVTVTKNSAPVAPGSLTVPLPVNHIILQGEVSVVFTPGSDVDGNLDHYDVAAVVGAVASAVRRDPLPDEICTSVAHDDTAEEYQATVTFSVDRGNYVQMAVRSVDQMGVASAWMFCSYLLRRNQLPSAPVLIYPVDNAAVCLSGNPMFGVARSTDADTEQTLTYLARITKNGEEVLDFEPVLEDRPGNPSMARGFRCGVNLAAGNYEIQMMVSDGLEYVQSAPVPFTVASVVWRRTISVGSVIADVGAYAAGGVLSLTDQSVESQLLIADDLSVSSGELLVTGEGVSHCADLTELINAVNARRAWFGLAAVSYDTDVGYFANWYPQMNQMAAALSACLALGGEAAVVIVNPFERYNGPAASVINTVRDAVESL